MFAADVSDELVHPHAFSLSVVSIDVGLGLEETPHPSGPALGPVSAVDEAQDRDRRASKRGEVNPLQRPDRRRDRTGWCVVTMDCNGACARTHTSHTHDSNINFVTFVNCKTKSLVDRPRIFLSAPSSQTRVRPLFNWFGGWYCLASCVSHRVLGWWAAELSSRRCFL